MIISAPSHLFVLQLWEGRYFPFDHQRLFCVASFNGESQQTGLSNGTPCAPSWSTALEWQLSASQLRSLQAAGSYHCKVTFAREDGRRVGWIVCDLRTAKLHAKHPKKPAWWALAGPFKGKDTPEVLLHFSLVEQQPGTTHPVPQQHQHQLHSNAPRVISPGMAAAAAASPTAAGRLYASQMADPGALGMTSGSAALQGLPDLASLQQLQTPVLKQPASHEPQPDAHTATGIDMRLLQQAGTLSEAIAADGSLRRFDFGVDLREFQAGRRLPLNLASVVVQLSLPQALAGLILQSNGRLPPRLAPLRTQPPVDVSRGSEAPLPGGQASVQFAAGLMSLATLLASNPVMIAEVWHKERLTEDCLLGRAHIPLSPLLQESWVDGRAGVFAMLPIAATGDGQEEVERVQIGTLHLVMSLEEVGPAQEAVQQSPPSHAPSPRLTSPRKPPPHLQPSMLRSNLAPQPPHPKAMPSQEQQNHLEQQGREEPPWQLPMWADAQQQQQQQPQLQPEQQPPIAQSGLQKVQQQGQDGRLNPVRESITEGPAQVPPLPAAAPAAVQCLAPLVAAETTAADNSIPVGSDNGYKPDALPAIPGTAPEHPGTAACARPLAQQLVPEVVGLANAGKGCLHPHEGLLAALPPQPPSTGFPAAPSNTARTVVSATALAAEPAVPASQDAARAAVDSSSAGMTGIATFDMPPAADAGHPSMLQALAPDIEAAWQLEVWKRQEQERWKAELKQREGERMAALEAEWRRREKERETEHAALRQEYTAMQSRTQQVLAAAEEREKKVVALEEGVNRRRKELEREHAARLAEAEATVRRLQMEFEHQLEMERLQTRQLQQQAAAAEEKGVAAEEKAAAAERALQEHKDAHARSPVGLLQQELGQARAALAEAQQRAAQAGEAKRKYKEQVVRLAQEVSALQRHLAEVVGLRRDQLESEVVKLAAQEAALAARREAGQLRALRQELRALQQGGSHGGGGGKDPVAGHDPALLLGRGAGTEQVQRLLQEREELLGSGAYARDDPLIQQLDTRIRECAAADDETRVE